MLLELIARCLKSKRFLICFAIILLLFLPVFFEFEFNPVLSGILVVAAFVLSMISSVLLSGVSAAVTAVTSGARTRELAKQFPELAELEKQRSRLVGMRLVFCIVGIAALILGFAAAGMYGGAAVVFLFFILYFLIIERKMAELRNSFKQIIVLDELTHVFNNVKFDPKGQFSADEIKNLQLFSAADRILGNDFLEADRNGVHFCRSDIEISQECTTQDEDGNMQTDYETIFEGSVLRFEKREPYPVPLLAITEGFQNIRGVSSNFGKLFGLVSKYDVETEMDEFNRKFDVYCADQVEARVILTPQMIEGINRVGQFAKHELAMLFTGKYFYLFLSMPGVDSFEVNLASSQSVEKQRMVVSDQVNYIADLIDNMYFKEDAAI